MSMTQFHITEGMERFNHLCFEEKGGEEKFICILLFFFGYWDLDMKFIYWSVLHVSRQGICTMWRNVRSVVSEIYVFVMYV